MADAVVGKSYTFQALFVDATNTPIAVVGPTISIFTFSQAGAKTVLVDAAAMNAVVPAEVGRYTYTYTIPGSFTHGDTIHAEMTAPDPGNPGTVFLVKETVSVISLASTGGLTTRFVQGG